MARADRLRRALDGALGVARQAAAEGAPARYIPELAKADPSAVGLALATVDGERHEAGAADAPFTAQSVSKVFALAQVLGRQGMAAIAPMACEPSGDAFHSIVRLEEERGHPRNPYINAGAILISGHLPGEDSVAKAGALQAYLGAATDGASFPVDEAVLRSEAATGNRNRALAHYMAHFGVLEDPHLAVETYFRQCALRLDTRRLARAGLFMANRGVDPVTGARIIDRAGNSALVAQMALCGLYDDVGQWALHVGVPAKSGVSGAILAIVPDRMAIAAYGPALGPKGNSTAGTAALRYLSGKLELSLF